MQLLKAIVRKIEISGHLIYNDNVSGYLFLRLKKRLREEYPELRQKAPVFYQMVVYKDYEELCKAANDLAKRKEAIPILLWFWK